MDHSAPSRRTVTRAAAWAAPAVVAATAAPAYAATRPTLTFVPGGSGPVRTEWTDGLSYWDLMFSGATLQVSGGSVPAGGLSATFSLSTSATGGSADSIYIYPYPTGWTSTTPVEEISSAPVFTHGAAVANGGSASLDGTWLGAVEAIGSGTFTATFQAPGFTAVTVTFPFPASGLLQGAAAQGLRGDQPGRGSRR